MRKADLDTKAERRVAANAILVIVLIGAVSTGLEFLAGWTLTQIASSVGSYVAIVAWGYVRFKSRSTRARDTSERLWIVVLWIGIIDIITKFLGPANRPGQDTPEKSLIHVEKGYQKRSRDDQNTRTSV